MYVYMYKHNVLMSFYIYLCINVQCKLEESISPMLKHACGHYFIPCLICTIMGNNYQDYVCKFMVYWKF